MSCPCDTDVLDPIPTIAPGLPELPRQIAGFPELREMMLAEIPRHLALRDWRARGGDDFGVMLLEMWAYVGDVISFYDKVLADEAYLRTARRRPAVRKLTGLLGYVPRPAVAASVRLALIAEGRKAVSVPVGTAFRSGAFSGQPPQVFEVDEETIAHPALNSFPVAPPRKAMLSGTLSFLLLEPRTAMVRDNDVVVLELGDSGVRVVTIAKTSRSVDSDGRTYVRADLKVPVALGAPVDVSAVRILKATQRAQLRSALVSSEEKPFFEGHALTGGGHTATIGFAAAGPGAGLLGSASAISAAGSGTTFAYASVPASFLTLDGVYLQLKRGDRVLVSKGGDHRTSVVIARSEESFTVARSTEFTVDGTKVTTPAVTARFTQIAVNPKLNAGAAVHWTSHDASDLTVHFGLVEAGRVATTAATLLLPSDPLKLLRVQPPTDPPVPARFFLQDGEDRGVEFPGALNWTTGLLTPNAGTHWAPGLRFPVTAYGNVASASRGETVDFEILGSGDASVANQSFPLQNGPLTYLASATADNDSGVASTLILWVDGVRWTEVATFFGQAPDGQVYVVRQKDDGESTVTFGDGIRGARLTTGIDNVMASYRFGAGAASPPAGSIKQLAEPVEGLRGAVNPVAAAGGADAETEEEIRRTAPRSALLLGRAVSIDDMEAAALVVPGVIAASAVWQWDGKRQRPVVKVWYVGAAGLETTVSQRLRALSDPATPIDVDVATAITPTLSIDAETDPRHQAEAVADAVKAALLDPETGLLARSRIGIGKALFRSRIFEAVLAVRGARGVRSLQWNGTPWSNGAPDGYGRTPGTGSYFDFVSGSLIVTGSASHV